MNQFIQLHNFIVQSINLSLINIEEICYNLAMFILNNVIATLFVMLVSGKAVTIKWKWTLVVLWTQKKKISKERKQHAGIPVIGM